VTQRLFTEINGFAVLLRGDLLWLKPLSVTVGTYLVLKSNLETLRFDEDELTKDGDIFMILQRHLVVTNVHCTDETEKNTMGIH